MMAKRTKVANAPQNDGFSAEIATSFKLSSSAHTAYRAHVGHGRFAGIGSSLLFFDPAETT
jgi:hypothetical protein